MQNADGTPIWFELITRDPDGAEQFYARLADWTVAPSPMAEHMGYRLAGPSPEAGVAGIMQAQDNMPTGWLIYFGVADVDAMAEKVKALGGAIHMGPMDIPHVGRFVFAADPQGVGFYLMTGSSPEPSVAFKPGEGGSYGHGVWIELATPDPDGAFDFYGKLFGWTRAGGMPMGELGEYAFIGVGDGYDVPEGEPDGPGAIMSSKATGGAAAWNWYIHVPDIDAAAATARDQGGTVLQEPMEIPGGEFAANVIDPQGSHIGLVGPRK